MIRSNNKKPQYSLPFTEWVNSIATSINEDAKPRKNIPAKPKSSSEPTLSLAWGEGRKLTATSPDLHTWTVTNVAGTNNIKPGMRFNVKSKLAEDEPFVLVFEHSGTYKPAGTLSDAVLNSVTADQRKKFESMYMTDQPTPEPEQQPNDGDKKTAEMTGSANATKKDATPTKNPPATEKDATPTKNTPPDTATDTKTNETPAIAAKADDKNTKNSKYNKTDKADIFQYANPAKISGWKFHIYGDSVEDSEFLEKYISPILLKHGWSHKIATSGRYSVTNQQGIKGMTAYAPTPDALPKMIPAVYNALTTNKYREDKQTDISKMKGDKPINKFMTYRYDLSIPADKVADMQPNEAMKYYRPASGNYNIENNPDPMSRK